MQHQTTKRKERDLEIRKKKPSTRLDNIRKRVPVFLSIERRALPGKRKGRFSRGTSKWNLLGGKHVSARKKRALSTGRGGGTANRRKRGKREGRSLEGEVTHRGEGEKKTCTGGGRGLHRCKKKGASHAPCEGGGVKEVPMPWKKETGGF